MSLNSHIISAFLICLFISCTSSTPEPKEVIEDPTATTLVFPEDNTECNEGTILNETQSRVNFRWNNSEFTDSYELILENLDTNASSSTLATTNSKEITIDRGTSYKWYIISKSSQSEETASSEEFKFFNAAPGVENHAPFPADVIAPENSNDISSNTGKITLEWEGADIDNDIKEYEVFFGTENPPSTSIGVFTNSTLEVDVISGSTYHWLVKTTDETGNISESEVFSFSVN